MEERVYFGDFEVNSELGSGSKNIETIREARRQGLGNLGTGGNYGKQETAR